MFSSYNGTCMYMFSALTIDIGEPTGLFFPGKKLFIPFSIFLSCL